MRKKHFARSLLGSFAIAAGLMFPLASAGEPVPLRFAVATSKLVRLCRSTRSRGDSLRSTLSTTANKLFIRAGDRSLDYMAFQHSIGDQRTRMLVYPSVWLFDPELKPLMQMPAGTGTFETVEEQLEILNLVQ